MKFREGDKAIVNGGRLRSGDALQLKGQIITIEYPKGGDAEYWACDWFYAKETDPTGRTGIWADELEPINEGGEMLFNRGTKVTVATPMKENKQHKGKELTIVKLGYLSPVHGQKWVCRFSNGKDRSFYESELVRTSDMPQTEKPAENPFTVEVEKQVYNRDITIRFGFTDKEGYYYGYPFTITEEMADSSDKIIVTSVDYGGAIWDAVIESRVAEWRERK